MRHVGLIITAFLIFSTHGVAQSTNRPNIVIFYADDLGWMDLSIQGSDYYETPNVDRIAQEGMRFTNAYANAANCAPSRASLMTGLYSPRHQIYTVSNSERGESENRRLIPIQTKRVLDTNLVTMPQYLKEQGYQTCMAGKWHLSPDASDYGFDANFGGHQSGGPKSYFSPYRNPQLEDGPQGEHLPARLASDVSSWIDQQRREEPFFVYLPFYSVHTPIQARADLTEKFDTKPKGTLHDHAKYAAMLFAMDSAIGQVLHTLEALEILDETLVIFSSDNGGYGPVTSQRPLRGAKGMFYEGGIRVPLFVRWPEQVAAGSICNDLVIGCDLFPTIHELIGDGTDLQFDGISLLPSLAGKQVSERSLFWHFPAYLEMYRKDRAFQDSHDQPWFRSTPLGVIRRGPWKLIEYFESGELELFNLEEDIGESMNRVLSDPAKAKEMHLLLQNWRKRSGAHMPSELNPEYQE